MNILALILKIREYMQGKKTSAVGLLMLVAPVLIQLGVITVEQFAAIEGVLVAFGLWTLSAKAARVEAAVKGQ
jgi:hypothetical protein